MGKPMAACVAGAGHEVRAFDTSPAQFEGLAELGITAPASA